MRLVQHRLDRLNFDEHFLDNQDKKFLGSDMVIDENVGLTNPDKLELLRKLQELELKKERMNAMIQRVENARAQQRNGNKEFSMSHSEFWSVLQQNSTNSLGNDQETITASSPTLSLLDSLRALEVPNEPLRGAKNKMNELQERVQNTINIQQELDHSKQDNDTREPQLSPIHNAARLSRYQDVDASVRSSDSFNIPRLNMPNREVTVNSYNMHGGGSIFGQIATKPNNVYGPRYTRPNDGRNIPINKQSFPRHVRNDGASISLWPQSSSKSSSAKIRSQIKDLEGQIEFLYNEVALASMGGSEILARESRIPQQDGKQRSFNPGLVGNNLQNSSNSSFVMLNNSIDGENDIGSNSLDYRDNTFINYCIRSLKSFVLIVNEIRIKIQAI